MARVRWKDTQLELVVRKLAFALGLIVSSKQIVSRSW
jgi:hypothetical protein